MPPDLPPLVPPYYPIIYVRGYAFSQSEVNATTEDPYMGFNRGATKLRQQEYANIERSIFEGPVVRLMKDYGYLDVYSSGSEDFRNVHPQSVIIYRYYESADTDLGLPSLQQATIGDLGPAEVMEKRATDLAALILKVRDGVCQGDAERERQFRVHLVAHSMGGLICRCLLQKFGSRVINVDGASMVDKVFTYATPHNGIQVSRLLNWLVPPYFKREIMRGYLNLVDARGKPLPGDDVNMLNGTFSPERFFCLVGTDWRDYDAALGLPRLAVGEGSDGLVRIANASVVDARKHEVHRSHSGPYGIVNSEEGYQNLVRFLFGHLRIDGRVIIDDAPRSPHGPVSLYTEATVAVVGSSDANLAERRKDQYSAVVGADAALQPRGTILYPEESARLFSLSFPQEGPHSTPTMATVDLAVSPSVPNGNRSAHLSNYFLFRKSVLLNVDRETRQVSYAFDGQDAFGDGILNQARLTASTESRSTFEIPLESANGFNGRLELTLSLEYEDTGLSRAPRGGFAGRDSTTGVAKKLEEDYAGMEG